MATKDIVTLVVSGLAFALSLSSTIITLWQKKFETERALRQQLTETIGKLNGVYEQVEKLRQEKLDDWNHPAIISLRSFYNGQKLLYARQATYLIDQLPKIASEVDFNSIARAFGDNDDDKEAASYFEKAIEASSGRPLYQAMNFRGYARMLFRVGRIADGRQAYERAISLVVEKSDSSHWFQAETTQRWAEIEADIGNREQAISLLERAYALYDLIKFPTRRTEGVRNLESIRKRILTTQQQIQMSADNTAVANIIDDGTRRL